MVNQMPSSTTTPKPSARERLLASANELFYREGVQSVGIDRVIEHAGVAKASLYNSFGSKEELVHAYLLDRQATTTARVTAAIEAQEDPRAKVLALFDSQAESQRRPGFRGCAFAAASAESKPGGLVEEATRGYRDWLRSLFTGLASDAGAKDPETLGRQLQLLYDGAASSGNLDHDASAADHARAAAEILLDASLDA
jgi:AcrR family transcriptional regulator